MEEGRTELGKKSRGTNRWDGKRMEGLDRRREDGRPPGERWRDRWLEEQRFSCRLSFRYQPEITRRGIKGTVHIKL